MHRQMQHRQKASAASLTKILVSGRLLLRDDCGWVHKSLSRDTLDVGTY